MRGSRPTCTRVRGVASRSVSTGRLILRQIRPTEGFRADYTDHNPIGVVADRLGSDRQIAPRLNYQINSTRERRDQARHAIPVRGRQGATTAALSYVTFDLRSVRVEDRLAKVGPRIKGDCYRGERLSLGHQSGCQRLGFPVCAASGKRSRSFRNQPMSTPPRWTKLKPQDCSRRPILTMSCRTGIGSGLLDTKILAEGLLVWTLQQEPDLDDLLTRTMAKCCSRFGNRGEERVTSGWNGAPELGAGNCPTRGILP
ncbi:hypothetical protein R1flu_000641 [Riccia fluitans]|uniref:Uncharacterized protein n=1 Tax=Riccia fluitans TaxID=41844 RepID=A0ABD1Y110_9MARC